MSSPAPYAEWRLTDEVKAFVKDLRENRTSTEPAGLAIGIAAYPGAPELRATQSRVPRALRRLR